MKNYNILVFPGGTEIGLEIQKALCHEKSVKLFSVGLDIPNHAPYIFERHFHIPSIHEPNWIECLNQIIEKEQIDYIFPAYDDIIVALIKNADKIKATIISSPLDTCLITRSKSQTYNFLKNILPVPKLYESLEQIDQYPVFIKPDRGQGSQGTHLVSTENQLVQLLEQNQDCIITEYLPGEEYTIDCFSDREKGLLFCGGRKRVRTKSGISMNSHLVNEEIFREYAEKISSTLTFYGTWFFQLKKDVNGTYKLLEIAPRIAGTMALNRVIGINFPLLSIYEHERIPLEILVNKINVTVDRALVNRYKHNLEYSNVYVDLDDTLIENNRVNTDLIKFLYQCINKNKYLILVTKHRGNLEETLKKHRLIALFDEIIHITKSANKTDFVCMNNSIFIDDSFSERKAISHHLGILTFDCSMLEMLLDERA